MHGSHLRRFMIFGAYHLVILSHGVCDFVSVILVDFLAVISDFGCFRNFQSHVNDPWPCSTFGDEPHLTKTALRAIRRRINRDSNSLFWYNSKVWQTDICSVGSTEQSNL